MAAAHPTAAPQAAITVGRILTGMGMLAFVLAVLAVVFGQSIKPMGDVADGLTLWQLIAILLVVIAGIDTAIGLRMISHGRAALAAINPGPKR
jgi:hypothetical protein